MNGEEEYNQSKQSYEDMRALALKGGFNEKSLHILMYHLIEKAGMEEFLLGSVDQMTKMRAKMQ